MLPYWLMFLLPSAGALFGLGQHRGGQRRDQAFLAILFITFAMVIGLRDETGGDFFNYKRIVDSMLYERFTTSLQHNDPAFTVIAEISNSLGFYIYGVNFACGVFFLYGLLRFVRTLPDPWLAIAAAVPYMVIVIAMGYIRQAVSIGFILLAIMDLDRKSYGWLAFHLGMALMFHIASVAVLPLFAIAGVSRWRYWRWWLSALLLMIWSSRTGLAASTTDTSRASMTLRGRSSAC